MQPSGGGPQEGSEEDPGGIRESSGEDLKRTWGKDLGGIWKGSWAGSGGSGGVRVGIWASLLGIRAGGLQGTGYTVHGTGYTVHGTGYMVQGARFREGQGSGPPVWGAHTPIGVQATMPCCTPQLVFRLPCLAAHSNWSSGYHAWLHTPIGVQATMPGCTPQLVFRLPCLAITLMRMELFRLIAQFTNPNPNPKPTPNQSPD